MLRKNYLSNILIVFGAVTLLSSLIDILTVLLPVHLSNPQWTFFISQDIAERSIIPLLGIVIILSGSYLRDAETNKIMLNVEKVLSIFSQLFGIGLVVVCLLYTLTIKTIENQAISNLKQRSQGVKAQLVNLYAQEKVAMKDKNVKLNDINKYFENIDKKLQMDIKSAREDLFKKNAKTITNLLLFALSYIFTGIMGLKSSMRQQKINKTLKNN